MLKPFIALCLLASCITAAAPAAAAADPLKPSDPAAIEAYRRLPYCKLAPDGKHLLSEPCRRPPTRSFEQRRSAQAGAARQGAPGPQAVAQLTREQRAVQHMLPPTAPMSPPRVPAVPIPPPVPPPAIQPLNQCDIAGCRGADGALYQQGAGNIMLDPSGRLCTRSGMSVQCQ